KGHIKGHTHKTRGQDVGGQHADDHPQRNTSANPQQEEEEKHRDFAERNTLQKVNDHGGQRHRDQRQEALADKDLKRRRRREHEHFQSPFFPFFGDQHRRNIDPAHGQEKEDAKARDKRIADGSNRPLKQEDDADGHEVNKRNVKISDDVLSLFTKDGPDATSHLHKLPSSQLDEDLGQAGLPGMDRAKLAAPDPLGDPLGAFLAAHGKDVLLHGPASGLDPYDDLVGRVLQLELGRLAHCSDGPLIEKGDAPAQPVDLLHVVRREENRHPLPVELLEKPVDPVRRGRVKARRDRKSTRLNSSHVKIQY